jgi:hypothetical protein
MATKEALMSDYIYRRVNQKIEQAMRLAAYRHINSIGRHHMATSYRILDVLRKMNADRKPRKRNQSTMFLTSYLARKDRKTMKAYEIKTNAAKDLDGWIVNSSGEFLTWFGGWRSDSYRSEMLRRLKISGEVTLSEIKVLPNSWHTVIKTPFEIRLVGPNFNEINTQSFSTITNCLIAVQANARSENIPGYPRFGVALQGVFLEWIPFAGTEETILLLNIFPVYPTPDKIEQLQNMFFEM